MEFQASSAPRPQDPAKTSSDPRRDAPKPGVGPIAIVGAQDGQVPPRKDVEHVGSGLGDGHRAGDAGRKRPIPETLKLNAVEELNKKS